MTKRRKSLQNKLRRKFGWKTGGLFHGLSYLCREKAEHYSVNGKYNDLTVLFSEYRLWNEIIGKDCGRGVSIRIDQFDETTGKPTLINSLDVNLTFDELELIYNIAKEKQTEAVSSYSKNENI